MARIRTIKPEFFKHEKLAELSTLHRLLFMGLWTLADREGRLKDRPPRIKAEVLPYDDCQVDRMLTDLASHSEQFIVRYRVNGEPLIQITNFLTHQRPHHKEPPSTIPPAQGKRHIRRSTTSKVMHEPSINQSCGNHGSTILVQDSSDPLGREGKGKDKGKGMEIRMDEPCLTVDELVRRWNQIPGVVPMREVSGPIQKRLLSNLKEHPVPTWWLTLFERIARSDFLCGRKADFAATLDWIVGPKNLAKIMAGNYDNRPSSSMQRQAAGIQEFLQRGGDA